ncbi:MAG: hypothetical protein R3F35_12665 [Myxococcota bacterium]
MTRSVGGPVLVLLAILALGCGRGDEGESVSSERVKQELRGAVEAATGAVSTEQRLLVERARMAQEDVNRSLADARKALETRPEAKREPLARAIDHAETARDALERQLDHVQNVPADRWNEAAKPLAEALEVTVLARTDLEAAIEGRGGAAGREEPGDRDG